MAHGTNARCDVLKIRCGQSACVKWLILLVPIFDTVIRTQGPDVYI